MSPSDPSRSYTRRLSQVLSSPDGTLALSLLQKLAAGQQSASAEPAPAQPRDGHTIGVWRRTQDESFVRRPEAQRDWQFWADVERLPVDKGRRRVAVLGESAARGYFFDPGTTYAGLVADCLRQVPGLDDVDVLDLARTNATAGDVHRTLHEVAQLRPEALVVFAGNNWYYPELTSGDRQRMADALRTGGYAASARLFHGLMTERAREFLDDLARTAREHGSAVVLVVPEFNLADWHEEPFLGCPVLFGSANAAWLRLHEEAKEALAAGWTKEAARIAGEMIELDGGASVTAHRLLATSLRDDAPDEAESALEAAKNAAIGRFAPHSPRMLTAVQDEMRAKAAEYGFGLVDLPAVLRRESGGRTPDRAFFLDYCHFNYEGLALAASETAAAVAPGLDATAGADAGRLRAALVAPPAAEQAAAHFLAAIHNAHIGQPAEVVRHLLDRALTLGEGVWEHLANYLDYQARTAPNWICASFERSVAVPELARYLEVSDPSSAAKLADHSLRATTLDLLARRGLADPAAYQDLLIAEHAAPQVDLLADVNRAPTWREQFGSTGQPHPYVVAPQLWTDTWLVLARPEDVELALTARLPAGEPGEAPVTVWVNGEQVASAVLGTQWRTERLTVLAGSWRTGLNTVRLRWPLRELPGDDLLEAAAQTLERGETPRSNVSHGHLYGLTAALRGGAQNG